MRRASWVREVLFLIATHQQAAAVAPRTTTTDTVEVQYNQGGPRGCPHAAEGLPRSPAMAKTAAPGLISGTG